MAPLKFKLEDLPQRRHHLRHFRADPAIRFRAVHTAGRPKGFSFTFTSRFAPSRSWWKDVNNHSQGEPILKRRS